MPNVIRNGKLPARGRNRPGVGLVEVMSLLQVRIVKLAVMEWRIGAAKGEADLGRKGFAKLLRGESTICSGVVQESEPVTTLSRNSLKPAQQLHAGSIGDRLVQRNAVPIYHRCSPAHCSQLSPEDRGLEPGDPVGSIVHLFVAKGSAARPLTYDAPIQFLALGQDRSALPRVHRLGSLVTERAEVTQCSNALFPPTCTVDVRTVLDNFEPVLSGNSEDFVHIGKSVVKVNRDNGPGILCDRGFDFARVYAEGVIYVDENGDGVYVDDRAGGRLPGQSREDDFVSRTNPKGFQCELNGVGAAVHKGSKFRVAESCPFLLKFERLSVPTGPIVLDTTVVLFQQVLPFKIGPGMQFRFSKKVRGNWFPAKAG